LPFLLAFLEGINPNPNTSNMTHESGNDSLTSGVLRGVHFDLCLQQKPALVLTAMIAAGLTLENIYSLALRARSTPRRGQCGLDRAGQSIDITWVGGCYVAKVSASGRAYTKSAPAPSRDTRKSASTYTVCMLHVGALPSSGPPFHGSRRHTPLTGYQRSMKSRATSGMRGTPGAVTTLAGAGRWRRRVRRGGQVGGGCGEIVGRCGERASGSPWRRGWRRGGMRPRPREAEERVTLAAAAVRARNQWRRRARGRGEGGGGEGGGRQKAAEGTASGAGSFAAPSAVCRPSRG